MGENNPHQSGVRRYIKSSSPRLRWTPELHEHFVEAVYNLGGKYRATPKRIMHIMGVNELKISHIKSHLQMYRSMKEPTNFDGVIMSIKRYQQDKPNHIRLPQRHRHVAKNEAERRKKVISDISEKFDNKEDNDGYHCQGTQGTSNSAITDSDHAEMNFWALGNIYQESNSESSRNTPINLDLTM